MAEVLSSLRDRSELQLSINAGDAYVDSSQELLDIQEAYRKTAYKYDIPQLLVKRGARVLSNQKKYALPSNFRKFNYVYVLGVKYEETELDQIEFSRNKFAVDKSTEEIIISSLPASNGTQYTLTNAESAGQTVTIELNSVSGLSVGDEIVFPDDANPEVTYVASVDSSTNTITARLDTSKSASAAMYRGKDNIMFSYYRTVNTLSVSSDVTLLPDDFDFYIPFYVGYLGYFRLEQYDEAAKNLKGWSDGLAEAFSANDKNSTGFSNQFSIS